MSDGLNLDPKLTGAAFAGGDSAEQAALFNEMHSALMAWRETEKRAGEKTPKNG